MVKLETKIPALLYDPPILEYLNIILKYCKEKFKRIISKPSKQKSSICVYFVSLCIIKLNNSKSNVMIWLFQIQIIEVWCWGSWINIIFFILSNYILFYYIKLCDNSDFRDFELAGILRLQSLDIMNVIFNFFYAYPKKFGIRKIDWLVWSIKCLWDMKVNCNKIEKQISVFFSEKFRKNQIS